ncbi:hypothetical protein [Streptomyces longwoodensis]|uniref:hypothetical protein n=1 Tax=Streptomyces longwoodensis TaxID=68231 RepID=UPI0034091E17
MSGFWRGSAEPRPRVERVVGFDQVLSSIPEQCAIAALAYVLYGATDEAIGERLGVTSSRARELIRKGISMMRHPMWADVLGAHLDADGQTLLVDEGLRAAVRKWRLQEFAPECRQCGLRYTPKFGVRGGRPRQYCSNACRQKAYRTRCR